MHLRTDSFRTGTKIAAFIVIGIIVFVMITEILVPNRNYPIAFENTGMNISELDSSHLKLDVLFLGSSHMGFGISPMRMMENRGMETYNGATSGQPIEMSYFLLDDFYNKGNDVKLVVLDAASLFVDDYEESRYRNVTDSLQFNAKRMTQIMDILFNNNICSQSDISYIFPIIRYHDRWDELTSADINDKRCDKNFLKGFVGLTDIEASIATRESVDTISQLAELNQSYTKYLGGQNISTDEMNEAEDFYITHPLEKKIQYLINIKDLCRTHGSDFLLVKIPVLKNLVDYKQSWSYIRHDAILDLSKELDFEFIDLLYDTPIDIDWTHDTCDGGAHLNLLGAEKTTDYLCEYISTNYRLGGDFNKCVDSNYYLYRKYAEIAHLELCFTLEDYLKILSETNQYFVIISSKDDMTNSLLESECKALYDMGIVDRIDAFNYGDSFIAAINGKKKEYSCVSNRKQKYETEVGHSIIRVISAGYLDGNISSIIVNDKEYSINQRGINFVVIDKESELVVDRATCDTWAPDHEVKHDVGNLLFEYQEYLLGRK